MCATSILLTKCCLLLSCTIILSTCDGEVDNTASESTTISTTISIPIDDDEVHGRAELTTVKSNMDEEAKLPVDLLSDDVLLDPNVVLARLSRRNLDRQDDYLQPPYDDGYNDWSRSSDVLNRKQEYDTNDAYENVQQESTHKKIKLYPVFPGK